MKCLSIRSMKCQYCYICFQPSTQITVSNNFISPPTVISYFSPSLAKKSNFSTPHLATTCFFLSISCLTYVCVICGQEISAIPLRWKKGMCIRVCAGLDQGHAWPYQQNKVKYKCTQFQQQQNAYKN